MRTEYCRQHIDKTAEECGLSERTAEQVKQAHAFEVKHPEGELSRCGTGAILLIDRIRDEEIQSIVISLVGNALKMKTPTGGNVHPWFTEKQVKAFIKRAELQVKKERQKILDAERQKAEDLKAKAAAKVAETKVEDPVFLKLKKLSEDLAAVTARCEINKKRLAIADETVEIHIEELREAEQKVKDAKAHRDGVQRDVDIDEKNIASYVEQMNKLKDGV